RVGQRSDRAGCVEDDDLVQLRVEVSRGQPHAGIPKHLIDAAIDGCGAIGAQSRIAVESVARAAVEDAEALVKRGRAVSAAGVRADLGARAAKGPRSGEIAGLGRAGRSERASGEGSA